MNALEFMKAAFQARFDHIAKDAKEIIEISANGKDVLHAVLHRMRQEQNVTALDGADLIHALIMEAFINMALPEGNTDMEAFKAKMNIEIDKMTAHVKAQMNTFSEALFGGTKV